MTTHKDSKLVEHLLRQQRKEIEDGGFTGRLMRALPQRKQSNVVVYLFLVFGILVFCSKDGADKVFYQCTLFISSLMELQIPTADSTAISLALVICLGLTSVLLFKEPDPFAKILAVRRNILKNSRKYL